MNQAFVDMSSGAIDSIPSHQGAVLVIEDCEPLLFYLNSALLALGYKSQLLAANLAEAHAAWSQHRDSISHVLLNYELPDGLGYEFASLILSERPDLSIIVTSGYDIASIRDGAPAEAGHIQFLQKPFRLTELHLALAARPSARALSASAG